MDVRRLIAPIARRLRLVVSRAVVRAVTDSLRMQAVQIDLLADESRDNVERFQNYGITSHPHPGAEAIVVAVGGSRDHLVAIAVDDRRYRLASLAAGEVALYDDLGHMVHLTRAGIVIDGGGHQVTIVNTTKLRVESPMMECTGDIRDRCDSPDGSSMIDMRATYNGHTHPENDNGGPTGVPIQLMGDGVAGGGEGGLIGDGSDNTDAFSTMMAGQLEIYIPPGVFEISAPLMLREGMRIRGAGRRRTFIKKTDYIGAVFLGVDTDDVGFEEFTIIGPGQWVGNGNKGIDVHVSVNEIVQSLSFRNVGFIGLNDICLYVGTGAFCSYDNVRMRDYGYAAFYIDGGDGHNFTACTTRNGIIGFRFNRSSGYGPTTITAQACYAEQAGIGFHFNGAVSGGLLGCGVEAPVNYDATHAGHSYLIDGGDNVSILSCLSRHDTVGAPISVPHITVKGGASNVKIDGFRRDNHATFAAPTWELDASAAGTVVLGGNNFTAGTINSGGKVSVPNVTVMP